MRPEPQVWVSNSARADLVDKELRLVIEADKEPRQRQIVDGLTRLGDPRTPVALLDRLENDPAELNALYHDLLIGVTRFFRDDPAFEEVSRSLRTSMRSLRSLLIEIYPPDLHTAGPARFVQETSLDRLRVYKFQTTRQRSLVRV